MFNFILLFILGKESYFLLQSCFFGYYGLYSSECRFCIIEGPETVQDFAKMELQEIQDNIRSRRNKIFLHMEEVTIAASIQPHIMMLC